MNILEVLTNFEYPNGFKVTLIEDDIVAVYLTNQQTNLTDLTAIAMKRKNGSETHLSTVDYNF